MNPKAEKIRYVKEGQWYDFIPDRCVGRVYAIRFSDGSIWDVENGWHPGPSVGAGAGLECATGARMARVDASLATQLKRALEARWFAETVLRAIASNPNESIAAEDAQRYFRTVAEANAKGAGDAPSPSVRVSPRQRELRGDGERDDA